MFLTALRDELNWLLLAAIVGNFGAWTLLAWLLFF